MVVLYSTLTVPEALGTLDVMLTVTSPPSPGEALFIDAEHDDDGGGAGDGDVGVGSGGVECTAVVVGTVGGEVTGTDAAVVGVVADGSIPTYFWYAVTQSDAIVC